MAMSAEPPVVCKMPILVKDTQNFDIPIGLSFDSRKLPPKPTKPFRKSGAYATQSLNNSMDRKRKEAEEAQCMNKRLRLAPIATAIPHDNSLKATDSNCHTRLPALRLALNQEIVRYQDGTYAWT
jgi:hypothetical protein